MKYIDTHCHLVGSFYESDVNQDIKDSLVAGIDKIIVPGTTIEDSLKAIELANNNQNVYAMVGIHPSNSEECDFKYLDNINPKDIVAVGEIGIDLYRESNPSLENQKKSFIYHLEYAREHKKPVVIHMRNSEIEVFDILKNYKDLKILMHSYTSTWEWAQKFLDLGANISISGIVTFRNAQNLQALVKKIPLNRLITETDSPFLTPSPHRGKHNKPEYVKHVTDKIAELRNEENIEVIKSIYDNSSKFFDL